MKKSVKRIALSLLLVLAAIVCCIFGAHSFNSGSNMTAEAASATQTEVKIETDKDMVAPGETITFTITITSGQSLDWNSISLFISPLKDFDAGEGAGALAKTVSQYFELDETYSDELIEDNHYITNIWEFSEEEGDFLYTYDTGSSSYQNQANDKSQRGFLISVGLVDAFPMPANKPVTFSYRLKLKDNAPSLGMVDFGLFNLASNKVAYSNGFALASVTHSVRGGNLSFNTKKIRIGNVSHDADLKTLNAGHGTASDDITVAESMSYVSTSADKTNFKLIPTADSTAKIEYGSGASNPTVNKTANSGDTLTIPLDDSGETVVKFKITAEDETTVKNYTLTIKSSYARLSALTSSIVRPSSGPAVSGTALNPTFAEGTFEYTMKVPSDFQSVDLTPTIKTGYGATGGDVTATGCTSSATTVGNAKFSITDITDGATVELAVTAKDGSSQKYKITFSVADVDVSISSLTMTEGSDTITNDAAEATKKGVDYYFELHEGSTYKGTFNITTTSSAATVTIDGTAYSSSTQYGTKSSYIVKVTAPAGNYKDYKVMVAQYVEKGDFRNLTYSIDGGAAQDVLSDPNYNAETRTLTLQLDPAQYVGKQFAVNGTETGGASISFTPAASISGSKPWKYNLKAGKNELTFTANAAGIGGTTYTFIINLVEGKNGFEDVVLKGSANNDLPDYSFSAGQTTYNLTVPYKGYEYLNMSFTADGILSDVYVVVGTKTAVKATHTANTKTHTYGSTSATQLVAGQTTVIKFYANSDGGEKGDEYTLNITREAADTNSKLASLDVTINGDAITEWDGGVYFDPDTLTYTYTTELSVGTAAKINIKATAEKDTSVVAAGSGTIIGDSDNSWTVANGQKAYTVVVTAEDGKAKTTYTITIKKVVVGADFTQINANPENGSSQSILDSFEGAGTTSSPKKYTLNYNLTDAAIGSKFYVQVELNSPDAKAVSQTSGFTLKDDTFEFSSLKFGPNVLKFNANSSAGTTCYELTVTVTEDINTIGNIEIKNAKGEAIDGFNFYESQYDYDISVPFSVSSVTVNITAAGSYEWIYGGIDNTTGSRLTNPTLSVTNLKPGEAKTVTVYGKANNGAGDEGDKYTIKITREEGDSNATLTDLTITIDGKPVTFDEGDFDPFTFEYTIHYEPTGSATSAPVNIQATPASGTVTGTGNKTFTIKNETTSTPYEIIVTAEDGTPQTYTVTVVREVIPGNFELLEFSKTGSASDYEDVFASAHYDRFENKYTLDLTMDEVSGTPRISIRFKATKGATVSQTGGLNLIGDEYSATIKSGVNTFTLTAKSNVGTTYTFEINLFEQKNEITNIAITSSGKPLDAETFTFNKDTGYYDFTVPNSVNALDLTVTTDGLYCSVLDQDGGKFSGTGNSHKKSITLKEGELAFLEIRAVSDKGDEGQRYTIAVTRLAKNSDTSLSKLEVTIGGKPVVFEEGPFDPNRLNYTIHVPEGTTSGLVNIIAEATSPTSDVTGAGNKPFSLPNSDSTASYPVKVKAEDGSEVEYTITISQKPIILNSDTTITNIKITAAGQPNLYDGVPAYVNYPELITVDNRVTSVNIVVTVPTATTQSFIECAPNEINNGLLRLEVGDNTVYVYAVAQDGTNEGGVDKYEFTIRRQPLIVGPDSHITFGEAEHDFVMSSDEMLVYMLTCDYKSDKLDLSVKLDNGGYYSVKKIIEGKDDPELMVSKVESGTSKHISLDYGTNVFSIDVESTDGRVKKSVVYVVQRGTVYFDSISSPEIPELFNDYKMNPDSDEFTYQVSTYTDTVNFNISSDLQYSIEKPATLSYGLNKCVITIYDTSNSKAGGALRTITINVLREKDTNFWFIMFWVVLALAVVMIFVAILLAVVRKKKNNDEPAIIVTPSGAAAQNSMMQNPMMMQNPQQNNPNYYFPPHDGQY